MDAGCLNKLREPPWSILIVLEQVHGFSNDRTGGAKRSGKIPKRGRNPVVLRIRPIQIRNQRPGINQQSVQRQFCFLICFPQESFGFCN